MSVKLYEEQGVTLNLIPVAEYITEFIKKISARNMRNVKRGSYQMKIMKENDREIILAFFKIDPKINTTCWLSNDTKIMYPFESFDRTGQSSMARPFGPWHLRCHAAQAAFQPLG